MGFEKMIKETKYVSMKNRDSKFWKMYLKTLDEMCEKNEIFMRGLFSVIISEYQDNA